MTILVKNIESTLSQLAPAMLKMDYDNVGLQVGDSSSKVKKILVSLNITSEVAEEAVKKKCDLIVSHHPLIFRPLKNIRAGEGNSDIIIKLVRNNISYIACHTNFDSVKQGVSFLLAEKIGLKNPKVLVTSKEIRKSSYIENYKLTVYVPKTHLFLLKKALAEAGAATIGEYDFCYFEQEGTGSFRPGIKATPHIGEKEKLSEITEIKLETIVPVRTVSSVIKALLQTHPYEEPAYDLYKLENDFQNYGLGAIGDLEKEVSMNEFLKIVTNKLKIDNVRFSRPENSKRIKRVAVMGGSGGDMWRKALSQGADAYLTAECDHHTFLDAKGKLFIVEATHQATEQFAVQGLTNYIKSKYANLEVVTSQEDCDPILYYNKINEVLNV